MKAWTAAQDSDARGRGMKRRRGFPRHETKSRCENSLCSATLSSTNPLKAIIKAIPMSSLLVILVNLGAVALFIYVLVNALF